MTEDLGPLHDAMQGLVLVISGEGDEGGLTTALDVLAAGFLAAGVAALFRSKSWCSDRRGCYIRRCIPNDAE